MTEAWAGAVAAGIDDELFWSTTPAETSALMSAMVKREADFQRADWLRAGTIAAMIYNIHRKKGAAPLRAKDFIREPPKQLTRQQLEATLDAWAARQNRRVEA